MKSSCIFHRFPPPFLLFLLYSLTLFLFLSSSKKDFIQAAKTYGRIIISEVYLPSHKKTIKPINLGGVAGGEKYIVHNILFKFALDSSGLFGGNNLAAAKVGGLELKGLMSYFRFFFFFVFISISICTNTFPPPSSPASASATSTSP